MSLQDFASTAVVKTLAAGYPGTGKTGSLASLANSGRYNLRVLALDGNTTIIPLLRYIKPACHHHYPDGHWPGQGPSPSLINSEHESH